MFGMSPTELLIVGVIAVLLFGSRLPSVARSAGKSLTELKRGMRDAQDEFRRTMHEVDTEPARTPPKRLAANASEGGANDGDHGGGYPTAIDAPFAEAGDEESAAKPAAG